MNEFVSALTALAAARTLDEITRVVRTVARRLTSADGVTFVLRDGDYCFYADEDAIAPLWKGKRFLLEKSVSGWAMLSCQPVALSDIYADARIPHDIYRPTFVKSLFMVPVGEGNPVAAIGAYWATVHEPTGEQREILHSLAHAAGMALRNIHLDSELTESAKRERAARERAETLAQRNDEFLTTLSHELRTPLHIIRNWVWQLKKIAGEDERICKAAEVIERNAALQSRLVEDLLDVSRATAGKLQIDLQLLDLSAMCASVVEVVQSSAQDRNVSLSFRPEQSPQIWGDPDRIHQILWNILTNALKFTPAGGSVNVVVTRGELHARVVIEDTGIGIEPDFLPLIFERFRQADVSATRRFGGLGLGLALVKELVELHKGTVCAESAGKDQGTKVTIEFPFPAVSDPPGSWLKRRAGIEHGHVRLNGPTGLSEPIARVRVLAGSRVVH